ncbi:MAG: hypothetical protein OXQ29_07835 [Rhodospirillaceae bacterium]|nr:hypothetical protein [Rhodospirillaceae bacterium]
MTRLVVLLTIAIVAAAVWITDRNWDFLSSREEPTTIVRNIALIAGGLIAAVIAVWRGAVAAQQVAVAKQEQYHARFQSACESFSAQGPERSHTRMAGVYAFEHLQNDEPGLALDIHRVLVTFLNQADPAVHDPGEFLAAQLAAEKSCDTIKDHRILGNREVSGLRSQIRNAVARAEARMVAVGIRPPGVPVEE